jgi:Skp family chaperone for outer membrane proteins
MLLAGLALLTATPVMAQQIAPAAPQPPSPAAAQQNAGPLIAGVCLLSQQAVFANAKVGVAASARIKQLTEQAQAEVDLDRRPIEAEAKALDADPKVKPTDRAARTQALTARMQAVQQKATLRQREIEATRQKAFGRIVAEENGVISQVYRAHGCGLLFDRAAVLTGNMGGDLTADVVKGLDARMTTITFDRETLPAGN